MGVCCDGSAGCSCFVTCCLSISPGVLVFPAQPGLVISHHADRTLNSFCQWQSGLMGKDGTRHDHAILLTGLDICSWKNEPCDTLGKAPGCVVESTRVLCTFCGPRERVLGPPSPPTGSRHRGGRASLAELWPDAKVCIAFSQAGISQGTAPRGFKRSCLC